KEAWIGKQVTVAGTYGGHGQNVEGGVAKDFHVIVNTPGASFSERRNAATCYLDQAPADDVKSRGPQDALIVTGTVKAVPRGLVDNYARRSPCRIVQEEPTPGHRLAPGRTRAPRHFRACGTDGARRPRPAGSRNPPVLATDHTMKPLLTALVLFLNTVVLPARAETECGTYAFALEPMRSIELRAGAGEQFDLIATVPADEGRTLFGIVGVEHRSLDIHWLKVDRVVDSNSQ